MFHRKHVRIFSTFDAIYFCVSEFTKSNKNFVETEARAI
jgi:hypothetical protein